MIKKLRKFSNMTILCVTENEELKRDIGSNCQDCKEIVFISSYDEIVEKAYDLVLVDYSCHNILQIMDKIKIMNPILPKIVILKDALEQNLLDCINRSVSSILKYPVNYDDLRLAMAVALNQSKRADKILLKEGVYYDAYRERFYNKDGAVSFTKFEFHVLKLLLDNHDKIISYEEIKEKVWKDKKMSIFTMRNVINKIRNKTYYAIIRNNSSKGYQIDSIS